MTSRLAIAAAAIGLLVLHAGASMAATLTVDDDLRNCPSAPYRTIRAALNAAGAGDQIDVCAGTYTEQVVIAKKVRLVGRTGVLIRPTALPESRTSVTGGRPVTGGILVDVPFVFIGGVQLDMSASGVASCGVLLTGVYFRNVSGRLSDSRVSGVRVTGQPGCDSGVGVYVESDTSRLSKAKVTLTNDVIENCQKGGVVANGGHTALKVRDGQVLGSGSSPAVENGIQIGPGARGRISHVAVQGQMTTVAGKTAAGILAYQPARIQVRGSTIESAQTGVFVVGQGLIVGNRLNDLVDGVVLMGNQSRVLSNHFDGASMSGVFVNGDINSIRFGSMAHMPVGVWFYSGDGNSFTGIDFAASVPAGGRNVIGGTRSMTEASAAPLVLSLCRTAADCDDQSTCTIDTCDTTTGLCSSVSTCDDSNLCTDDLCGTGGCVHVSNTLPCDDGNACSVNDSCRNGLCSRGAPISCDDVDTCTVDACGPTIGCVHLSACDDRNPCTADTCDAVTGCKNTVLPNGTACPDRNPCNGTEVCQGGVCVAGGPTNCDDSNPCTIDSCNTVTGCQHAPVTNNVPCSDGNACNGVETCQAGACRPGTVLACDDGNGCTADSCNAVGGCVHTPIVGCRPCTVTADCDDSNACTTDVCNGNACQNTPVANGTACPDATVCNGAETCQAGVCGAGTALNCNDANVCTADTCDPVAGCRHTPVADGTSCADGTVCNGAEICQAGVCTSTTPLNCDDGNPCTTDVCLAISGCQHTALANGTSCADTTVCNGAETCTSGACVSGAPLNCNDGNACTLDTCDAAAGCRHTPFSNGTPCPDGTVCNGAEACQAGACMPNAPLNCNDGNACTTDTCNAVSGCINTPIAGCRPCAVAADCNDNQPCTSDTCNAGVCQNAAVADGTTCLDGNLCNGTELCSAGICTAGTALNCDDVNPCTTDTCDAVLGCQHAPVLNGTACPNSTVCDGNETCQAGVCRPGTPPVCNDLNPCTLDVCNAVSGCQFTARPDGTSCADANVCNGAELCQVGLCMPGTPLNCDDGNPCTTDSCSPLAGCLHVPISPCP